MAGRGPTPKEERHNPRDVPKRGEWTPALGVGWQHGEIPKPPKKLLKASREAWETWFRSWFASHWTLDDVPGLEIVILLYDQVKRGEHQRANELRLQMDTYGITPKGQQDRRWKRPAPSADSDEPRKPSGQYSHLRAVE